MNRIANHSGKSEAGTMGVTTPRTLNQGVDRLRELRHHSVVCFCRMETVYLCTRARRDVPKHESLQLTPSLHVRSFFSQTSGALCSDETSFSDTTGIDDPTVMAADNQQVDLTQTDSADELGDIEVLVNELSDGLVVHDALHQLS